MTCSNLRRIAVAVIGALVLAAPAIGQDTSPHLRMGNPSDAQADESNKDNYLMVKKYFALSYNNTDGRPNWVSWRLSASDLGHAGRYPFHPDESLPEGFKQIKPSDYTGSGFDRGHMCPHSDRAKNAESSKATFVMTNMVPQSPNNNQKAWAQLENYLRDLVENKSKTIYIVAGPHGRGGTGRNGLKSTVPNHSVVVPDKTWKVALILDEDVDDVDELQNVHVRLLGVVVPNNMAVGDEWAGFRTSVKSIEELTGFTFFDKVSNEAIGHLKEEVDDEPIPEPVVLHHGD